MNFLQLDAENRRIARWPMTPSSRVTRTPIAVAPCRRESLLSTSGSVGQKRARPHGNAGIPGIVGILESVSYRFYWSLQGSNPTLSAKLRSASFGGACRLSVVIRPPVSPRPKDRLPPSPPIRSAKFIGNSANSSKSTILSATVALGEGMPTGADSW